MLWTGVGSFGLLLVVLLYATAGNKTPEFFFFCFVIALIIASGSIALEFNRKYRISVALVTMMQNFLESLEDFSVTKQFISPDRDSMIAIDEVHEKIVVVFRQPQQRNFLTTYNYDHKIFSFQQLVGAEVLEDKRPLRKRFREDALSELHRPVKRMTTRRSLIPPEKISTLELRVMVREMTEASCHVNFLPLQTKVSKESKAYVQAKREIVTWDALLQQFIEQAGERTNAMQ